MLLFIDKIGRYYPYNSTIKRFNNHIIIFLKKQLFQWRSNPFSIEMKSKQKHRTEKLGLLEEKTNRGC